MPAQLSCHSFRAVRHYAWGGRISKCHKIYSKKLKINILAFRYSEISLLVEFWKEQKSIWKAAPLLPTYTGHSTHLYVANAVPQCSPGLSPQPPPSCPKPIRPKSTPVPICPHEPPLHDSQGLGSPTSITNPNTLASWPHLERRRLSHPHHHTQILPEWLPISSPTRMPDTTADLGEME